MSEDVFAKLAARREEEQREIEQVGVFGKEPKPVKPAKETPVQAEPESVPVTKPEQAPEEEAALPEAKPNRRPPARGKKKKADSGKEEVYHLTLSLPVSVAKGLKIMAIENLTSASALVEKWYYEKLK